MAENPSYYAIIPANIRYDNTLKANEKLLYGEITCLTQSTGKCFASNAYFAELYGVSKTSISVWINNLIKKGYLKSVLIYKEGTKEILNRYLSLVIYPIQENFNTPIKENFKDNTTSINTTSIIKENIKENLAEQFIKEKNVTQQSNKDLVIDFVEYRKLIKKPLRTIAPIQQLIDNLILLKDLGYSFDYCIEQMKSNEWQTVKKDYIHKAKPQQSFKKSNTDGNAEFIRQHYGINEDGNIIDTEIM